MTQTERQAMLGFDALVEVVRSYPFPITIGIDGLPVSGKSTLANRLIEEFDAECLWLDDFLEPSSKWPVRNRVAFPFNYIRYADFMDAVRSLVKTRFCTYFPYDWTTDRISPEATVIQGHDVVVVEGVSALHPDLAPLYDLRIWVESDAATTFQAATERDGQARAYQWKSRFLPSVGLYIVTNPRSRSDIVVAGRGLSRL